LIRKILFLESALNKAAMNLFSLKYVIQYEPVNYFLNQHQKIDHQACH